MYPGIRNMMQWRKTKKFQVGDIRVLMSDMKKKKKKNWASWAYAVGFSATSFQTCCCRDRDTFTQRAFFSLPWGRSESPGGWDTWWVLSEHQQVTAVTNPASVPKIRSAVGQPITRKHSECRYRCILTADVTAHRPLVKYWHFYDLWSVKYSIY